MQRSSVEQLARDPAGRYVAGDSFVHFCADPGLWGVILWGRPDAAQAYELGRSLVLELGRPHVAIFDASRLVGSDPGAFQAAERYLMTFSESLASAVIRLALVRPEGINGAVIAGAFDVLPRPFPVRVCDDAGAAFEWLAEAREPDGWWPDDGAGFLDALHREVTRIPRTVPGLRDFLDANLIEVRLDGAARALGVSTRTLQRQLGEAGTSFTAEVSAARIRAARRLLIESEASLTEIAMEIGCKTLQQFSALFRREVGESPSAFRARYRS